LPEKAPQFTEDEFCRRPATHQGQRPQSTGLTFFMERHAVAGVNYTSEPFHMGIAATIIKQPQLPADKRK